MRPILGALTATDKALFGVPPTSSDESPIVGPSESLARANPADHPRSGGVSALLRTNRPASVRLLSWSKSAASSRSSMATVHVGKAAWPARTVLRRRKRSISLSLRPSLKMCLECWHAKHMPLSLRGLEKVLTAHIERCMCH